MSFVGDTLEGVGDVIGDVAEFAVEDVLPIASTVASFVPGPWQAPALAFKGAQSLAGGNPIGAALSFAGAGGWSPFGGGSDFGGFDPGGALFGQTGGGMDWLNQGDWGSFDPGGELWGTGGTDFGGMNFGSFDPGGEGVWTEPASARFRLQNLLGLGQGTGPFGGGAGGTYGLNRLFGGGGQGGGGGQQGRGGFLDMLGRAAPGLLGAYGSRQQGSVLQGIADRARGDRAPFLAKANEWLAGGPEAYGAGPGAGALRGVLAQLSASGGNPIGSGTALSIASQAGLQDWRAGVTGMANLGLSGEDARLQTQAAQGGNVWPGFADAAASVFTPRSDLEELLRRLGGAGGIFTPVGSR